MSELVCETIQANYHAILGRIAQAATSVGRKPSDVELVVVTKGHPAQVAQAAYQAGARLFGENYAEEGIEKRQACTACTEARWDMIGHVQSRKAALAARNFDRVHSVDSIKLAQRLARFAAAAGRDLPVLLECNVSGEMSKFGFPAFQDSHWPRLLPELEQIVQLPHVHVQGLMTMAPFFDQPEAARPYFRKLGALQRFLQQRLPCDCWTQLSMGMSGDFEAAIQEGATIVRIGTAIVGSRSKA